MSEITMGKLTAREVQSIVKSGIAGRYGDGDGLYLMVPKSGKAYWMLRYTINNKRRSITLGPQAYHSLADVRVQCVLLRKLINEGVDPIEEKRSEKRVVIRTVNDLFEDWFKGVEKRLKHPRIPHRIFSKEISPIIGALSLVSVSPIDIRTVIQKVASSGRPSIANDSLMYLKQIFNHGIKLGLINYNPASAFNVNDAGGVEKSRSRALSSDEVKDVFKVFRENSQSFTRDNYIACCLLLLLGVRKSELIESRWDEIDFENRTWSLPSNRSKSGVAIQIPIPNYSFQLFQELHIRACGSDYVFPNRRASKSPFMGKDTLNRAIAKLFGIEQGKKKLPHNKMGKIEYFTVHDLRRTSRSLLSLCKVPSHVAERCMNHKIKGVEGVYDRYDYLEERRDALTLLEKEISSLL
jgi:integrase